MASNQLTDAMEAGDMLAEAERRYRIIAGAMEGPSGDRPLTGTELKALSIEADRLMVRIAALRAERSADKAKTDTGASGSEAKLGKVVEFNADRFRDSG